MPLKLNSTSGGSVTLQEPTTASNRTLTLPDNTGTLLSTASTFAGTGPTFSAYLSSSQTPSSGTFTKVTFQTELWDTASCYDNSTNYRFTPTVAGYYQVNSTVNYSNNTSACLLSIYRNGSEYKRGNQQTIGNVASSATSVSGIVYCNGSTDYVEIYIYHGTATALSVAQAQTFFDACLVRGA